MANTQSITKFLRTSTNWGEIFECVSGLLARDSAPAAPLFPLKHLFVAELVENRLNNEKLKVFDMPQLWQILHLLLDELFSSDAARVEQRFRVLQSVTAIKYVQIWSKISSASALDEFYKCFAVVLDKALITEAQGTRLEHFCQAAAKHPQSLFVERVYKYLCAHELVNPEFNNDKDQTFSKIKDRVKFHKENNKFLVQHFVESGLLAACSQPFVFDLFLKNSLYFDTSSIHKNLETIADDALVWKLYTRLVQMSFYGSVHTFSENCSINEQLITKFTSDLTNVAVLVKAMELNVETTEAHKQSNPMSEIFLGPEFLGKVYQVEDPNVLLACLRAEKLSRASHCLSLGPDLLQKMYKKDPNSVTKPIFEEMYQVFSSTSVTLLKFLAFLSELSPELILKYSDIVVARLSVLSLSQTENLFKQSKDLAIRLVICKHFSATSQAPEFLVQEFHTMVSSVVMNETYFEVLYRILSNFRFEELGEFDYAAVTGTKFRYQALTSLRVFENGALGAKDLNAFFSKMDVSEYIDELLMRYFTVFDDLDDANLQKVCDAVINSSREPVFNPYLFESRRFNEKMISSVATLKDKQFARRGAHVTPIVLQTPIECFRKQQKTEILNKFYKLATRGGDSVDKKVFLHLLTTFKSELETDASKLYEFCHCTETVDAQIVAVVVSSHLHQHEDAISKKFVSEYVDRVGKFEQESDIYRFHALVGIANWFSFDDKFLQLQKQFSEKAFALLKSAKTQIAAKQVILEDLSRIDIRYGNLGLSTFEKIARGAAPELQVGLFAVLPRVHGHSFQFELFYLSLYTCLENKQLDAVLFGHYCDVSLSRLVLLYTYLVKQLPQCGQVLRPLNLLLKALKPKLASATNVDKKKLLASLLSRLVPNDAPQVLLPLLSTALAMNYAMCQFSFETVLVLLHAVCKEAAVLEDADFDQVVSILLKIFLSYRKRVSGRYYMVMDIMNELLGKLGHSVERAEQFGRLMDNLCAPNDQAAKSMGKLRSSTTTNILVIKREVRKHVPSVLLKYIKMCLGAQFAPSVNSVLTEKAMFCVLDCVSETELRYINGCLDASGRAMFRNVHESYQRSGRWHSAS